MEESNEKNKGHGSRWTEDENQVIEILAEMRREVLDLEAKRRLPFSWGSKRKRSVIRATPSSSPPLSCEKDGVAVVKAEDSMSPATPLAFSLAEYDNKKPNPLRSKASLKKKREYCLGIIEDLTKTKATLNEEIDNVTRYCDKLKVFNLKLKARIQELSNGPKSETKNHNLEIGCQMQLVHAPVNSSNSSAENDQKQQQLQQLQLPSTPHYLMINQVPGPSQRYSNEGLAQFHNVLGQPTTTSLPSTSASSALGQVKSSNMGPLGVFDLNFSPEECNQEESCQPLDGNMSNEYFKRAMAAAQARQRRIQKYRHKNPIGNSKRYSYRC